MKILLVSPGFPPDKAGGIENYVHTIFNEMNERGHSVNVVTGYNRRRIGDSRVFQISVPKGEFSGYSQWALRAWLKASSLGSDVMHFNGFPAQILSLMPTAGVPRVVHVHNSITQEPQWYTRDQTRHKLGYLLASRAYRRANAVISPTRVEKEELLSHVKGLTADKVRVIPNCIDTKAYVRDGLGREVRERYALGDKFVILYFGKIKATKGVETLCKAFSILRTRLDAALIVGGAPTATDGFFNHLSSTYKDVIFTGFVRDPRPYYAAADAFCIYTPGFHGGEVFPIAVLEAMSMALPIVCTENPIFREITQGNAVFGKPNSPEALAECLLTLAQNEGMAKKMGKKNRALAASEYDSASVARKVEELYREVAN